MRGLTPARRGGAHDGVPTAAATAATAPSSTPSCVALGDGVTAGRLTGVSSDERLAWGR
jgi:hypothetical protein